MGRQARRSAARTIGPGGALVALLGAARMAAADGDALRVEAGGVELEASGYLQIQVDTTPVATEPPWRIRVRRARPRVEVKLGDDVEARLEPELFSSPIFFNDAYARLRLHDALWLKLGRMSRPFELVDDISARDLAPIERGARIRGIDALDHYGTLENVAYAGRAIGIAAEGELSGGPRELTYSIGYYRGGLGEEEVGAGDIGQIAGRVTYAWSDAVAIGASVTTRDFRCDECTPPETRQGSAVSVDVLHGDVEEPGLLALLSVSGGVYDRSPEASFVSGQAWLAYRFEVDSRLLSGVQPLLRASHGRPGGEDARRGGTLLTAGVNLYVTGKNRVMLDHETWIPNRGAAPIAQSVKAQLQLTL